MRFLEKNRLQVICKLWTCQCPQYVQNIKHLSSLDFGAKNPLQLTYLKFT